MRIADRISAFRDGTTLVMEIGIDVFWSGQNQVVVVILDQIERFVGDNVHLKDREPNCLRTAFNERVVIFNGGDLIEGIQAKGMIGELRGIAFEP
jgi:hypothetical protein